MPVFNRKVYHIWYTEKTLNRIVPEQSDFLTKTIDMSLPDPGPNTVNMKTSTELIVA